MYWYDIADEMDTLCETARKYLDIVEVWMKMFSNTKHVIRGNPRRMALCPFHAEKTPSMRIYEASQRFHCYGCGKDGDVVSLFELVEGCEISSERIRQLPASLKQERVAFFKGKLEEYLGFSLPS